MGRVVDGINNVKIFVLYLMENINYPLDYLTINDIVMQTDYVMYLDFAESFHSMLDDGLVEKQGVNDRGEDLFAVTGRGRLVARELHSDLLSSILDESLECALRYLDFRRRGIVSKCSYEKTEDGRYFLTGVFLEKGIEIFRLSVMVDTLSRAEQMKKNFQNRPEAIYRGGVALFAGNVNFLFDK